MDVDWQSSDFLEDDDYEGTYEIQESFLALKHIDKSTNGKQGNIKQEKSMMELINECKTKNTAYETLMNTWKNVNTIPDT